MIEIRRDALPVEVELAPPRAARLPARRWPRPPTARRLSTGEQWQAAIFAVAADHGLDAKAAFNALYLAFLGRPNGPRAGWLLASLERDFVIRRLTEAGAAGEAIGMSVGVQRLREEPDRIRQGAIDKREDPAARRPGDRGRRRRGAGSSRSRTRSRPSATRPASRSARRSAAARRPTAPRSPALRAASHRAGERIDAIDAELAAAEAELEDLLLRIPNPADPEVPVGGEEANVTVRTWGEQRAREDDRPPTAPPGRGGPHWELGEALDIIDNVARREGRGLGLPRLQGRGQPRSSAASSSWFLDVHTTEHGFTEVWPPAVVNTASARGTGQIPDKEDQMYVVTRDELYLVPTAEVPVTNLLRDEILEADELPVRYAAYTPCFRREAGAAGKDTRGHPPRPPVRQGRDGAVREAGGQRRGARVDDRRVRRSCSSGSGCRTGCS